MQEGHSNSAADISRCVWRYIAGILWWRPIVAKEYFRMLSRPVTLRIPRSPYVRMQQGLVAIKIMRCNDMMRKAAEKEVEVLEPYTAILAKTHGDEPVTQGCNGSLSRDSRMVHTEASPSCQNMLECVQTCTCFCGCCAICRSMHCLFEIVG
eukprot:6463729-Amphidinium_carterae.1